MPLVTLRYRSKFPPPEVASRPLLPLEAESAIAASMKEQPAARPNAKTIEEVLLRLIAERRAGTALDPTEIARELGGPHPDGWGPLMQPIRRAAVTLAEQGRLVILRKGKPVDPRDFKGVYRLMAPRLD